MKFSEIVAKLGNAADCHSLIAHQDCNPEITGVASVDKALPGTLSYIEGSKFAAMVNQTTASALILPGDEALQTQATDRGIAWIATTEPRLMFARAINLFYHPFQPQSGIHPSAVIDPSAVVGEDV